MGLRVLPGAEPAEDDGEPPRSVVLPDNGDLRRHLEKIKTQLTGGHFADSARHLGQLLQDREVRDFFLSDGNERNAGRSFHGEIRRLIAELPPEGRAAYLGQFDGVARQQLAAALESGGEAALRDIIRRFPLTSAAAEAQYRLGHWLWEHGRPAAAIAVLERLHGDASAAAPFEPILTQLLVACRERVVQREPATFPRDGWTNFRGSPDRNVSTPGATPLLAARWTREVATDPGTRRSLDYKSQAHRDGRGTYLPLLNPLAIDDLILMRTPGGVAAFDFFTGERRWQLPPDEDALHAGYDQLLWSEPTGGAFSADSQCVYLLDGAPASPGVVTNSPQTLTAREHFQLREGRLRWCVGGSDGGDEPALAGAAFLGPPLSFQGRLYVEIEQKGGIALAVLDPRTGRLDWSLELALVERPLPADPFRRLAGAVPSIADDELIVCPTAGGAVVAVDLTTQSLAWAYRYARVSATAGDVSSDFDSEIPAPDFNQRDRWLDGTVTLGRDCVLLSPPESADLHCLDRRDGLERRNGHLRWTKPRGIEGLFVACLTDRHVLVADRTQLRALNLADGETAWTTPLPSGAFVSGRGVLCGARYMLPATSGALLEIDVASGAIHAEHRSPREIVPGNLIWHRGMFVSLGPDYLQAFEEREMVERRVGEALAANPNDATALLRRGDLELAAGQPEAALVSFRKAHRENPTPATRAKLTSALVDALRWEGSNLESLQQELDALR